MKKGIVDVQGVVVIVWSVVVIVQGVLIIVWSVVVIVQGVVVIVQGGKECLVFTIV